MSDTAPKVNLRALIDTVGEVGRVDSIARHLDVERGTAGKHLRKARAAGYVTSTPAGRGDWYELTAKGEQARRGIGQGPECPRCCRTDQAKRKPGNVAECGCGNRWQPSSVDLDAMEMLAQPEGRAQLDMFGPAVAL